jgi:hypothetical protein
MYSVMIRIGKAKKGKRKIFDAAADAEAYFNELCKRRTDYPAMVVLAYRFLVKKRYQIDKNWKGDRLLLDEDLEP